MSEPAETPALDPLWYFRVKGQEWGPVSTGELLELVQRGRLAPHDQVKLEQEDQWAFIGDVEGLYPANAADAAHAAADILAAQNKTTLHHSMDEDDSDAVWNSLSWNFSSGLEGIISFLIGAAETGIRLLLRLIFNRLTAGLVVLCGLVFISWIVVWQSWSQGPSIEIRTQQTLSDLWNELKTNRENGASVEQWDDLADRSKLELTPLLEELSRSTGHNNESALWLLQAGRDFWPGMLEEAKGNSVPGMSETYFDRRLEYVQASVQASKDNWLTYGIVGIDVIVVIVLAIWWMRR